MRKQIIAFMVCVAGALSLTSCKKKAELSSGALSTVDEQSRYSAVLNNRLEFNTFQSKVNVGFNDGKKSLNVNGTIKIEKNKKLQISLQPFLGIEVFRAEFSNDSVKVLDRINKRYVAEAIGVYLKSLPVDVRFETVQALFMNYMFVPGNENLNAKDFNRFSWRTESDGLMVGRQKDQDLFNLHFFLNRNNNLSQTRVSNLKNTHAVDWNYTVFENLNGALFPMKSNLQYKSGDKKITAELTYSKVEVNKPMNMQFAIPASYRKIELSDLVKSLVK
ncbi:MAG: DUF4292 domain-containing protein [Bacteroidales bacterium]